MLHLALEAGLLLMRPTASNAHWLFCIEGPCHNAVSTLADNWRKGMYGKSLFANLMLPAKLSVHVIDVSARLCVKVHLSVAKFSFL